MVTVTARLGDGALLPQVFVVATETWPEVAVIGKLRMMLSVVAPHITMAPGGRLQAYPVAPATGFTL